MVLSTSYLLRRGFCCGNGCRNCPYPADVRARTVAQRQRERGQSLGL
jgi:hypothetical protein